MREHTTVQLRPLPMVREEPTEDGPNTYRCSVCRGLHWRGEWAAAFNGSYYCTSACLLTGIRTREQHSAA
jgi:hypothetical protein